MPKELVVMVNNIKANPAGFNLLGKLAERLSELRNEGAVEVYIDFEKVSWFSAEMSAPLSAILAQSGLKVSVSFISAVAEILNKNGFLNQFMDIEPIKDVHHTTIPLMCFNPSTDMDKFKHHLQQDLIGNKGFKSSHFNPQLIVTHLAEVYNNAIEHSQSTQDIFTCGQLYPNQKRLEYVIVDTGIGFRENLKRANKDNFQSEQEALEWSFQKGTTARNEPGGLGLYTLDQYMRKENGGLKLLSKDTLRVQIGGNIRYLPNIRTFPGTIVLLTFTGLDL